MNPPNVANLVDRLASRLSGLRGKHKVTTLFAGDDELRSFFSAIIQKTNQQEYLAAECNFSLFGRAGERDIMPSAPMGAICFPPGLKDFLLRKMADYGKPKESKSKRPKLGEHQTPVAQQQPQPLPQQPSEQPVVLATPSAQPLLVGAMAATGGVDGENTVMHLPPSTIMCLSTADKEQGKQVSDLKSDRKEKKKKKLDDAKAAAVTAAKEAASELFCSQPHCNYHCSGERTMQKHKTVGIHQWSLSRVQKRPSTCDRAAWETPKTHSEGTTDDIIKKACHAFITSSASFNVTHLTSEKGPTQTIQSADYIRCAACRDIPAGGVTPCADASSFNGISTHGPRCIVCPGSAQKRQCPSTDTSAKMLRFVIFMVQRGATKAEGGQGLSKTLASEANRGMRLMGLVEGEAVFTNSDADKDYMRRTGDGRVATFKFHEVLSTHQLKAYFSKTLPKLRASLERLVKSEAVAAAALRDPLFARISNMAKPACISNIKAVYRSRGVVVPEEQKKYFVSVKEGGEGVPFLRTFLHGLVDKQNQVEVDNCK